MSLTFIEVCAGAGGMSAGFMSAGYVPLLLNEIDPTCCETLRANHPGANVVKEDMTKLNVDEYAGKVDVLIGGPPCQSFSQAGQRKGLDDERGDLIMKFKDLLVTLNPKAFLMENVKGLLSHDGGKTFETILKNLNKDDLYDIKYKVLNANDYEVPQKRERVIVVGVRKDLDKTFEYPEKCDHKPVLKDVLEGCPTSDGYEYTEAKKEIMKRVPPGGCWVDLPEDIQKSYMGKSYHSGGGKRGIARRLSMDEPSLTLTTSPNQKQTERCHPTETRPLRVREYARIQTFPDDYAFSGSIAKQYKQIGNAVPVKLAYHLAMSLKPIVS